jgi:tetratricopeptide (TPR) repeat protein
VTTALATAGGRRHPLAPTGTTSRATSTPGVCLALVVIVIATGACRRDPQATARAFVASADRYASAGELAEAVIEYRNAIKHDDGAASTHVKLGLVYERLGDADRAAAAFLRAAEIDPAQVDARLRASATLLGLGRYAEARLLAQEAVSVEPRNVTALAIAAAADAGLGNFVKARRALGEALAIEPRSAFAHRAFGTALLRRGELADAREMLQKAVDGDAGTVAGWTALAEACWRLGDITAAESAFERAVQVNPDSAEAHQFLAAFYLRTGRAERAEGHLRMLADRSVAGRLALADYYMAANRNEDAAGELTLITDTRFTGVIGLRRAALHYRRGDKAEAYRQLDAVSADTPVEPDARLLKSQFLLRDADVAGAIKEAERSAALRPGWPEASYAVGVIQLKRGDAVEATRWLRRARAEGADGPAIDLGLARAALAQGQIDQAITLAEAVVSKTPSLQSYLVLAGALRGKGDFTRARGVVAKARAHWADAPALDIEEGRLELAAHRPGLARRAFTRALRQSPASASARAGLIASTVAGGEMSSARSWVDQWLASDPSDIHAMLLSAQLATVEGRPEAAERTLLEAKQAAPADPDVAEALARLSLARGNAADAARHMARAADNRARPVAEFVAVGMLREKAGDVTGAATAYERALALDPDAAIAANNLAWIYASGQRIDEALELAERAQRTLRDLPQSLHTLGWMYYRRGLNDRAIDWLQRARDRAPDNPLYRRDLAQAYSTAGRAADAERELAHTRPR